MSKKIPVVYIAGPFRAPTPWDLEQNIRRAEEVALEVARAGAMPLCPHANTRFFNGQCTDEFWLNGTMELLRRCDALVTVDGWSQSEGSISEVNYSRSVSMPIFHGTEGLEVWVKEFSNSAE